MTEIIRIENKILSLRGKQVMLDSDLAELYEVETKVLNQAVSRNKNRFPENFMFQLTRDESQRLRSQIVTLQNKGHFRYMPKVFTEHGILMLASVLKSEKAIQTSIKIIETFVKLREYSLSYEALAKKIREHDRKLDIVFRVIDALNKPVNSTQRQIGFKSEEKKK